MKKFVLILGLFICSRLYGDEYLIKTIDATTYNKFLSMELEEELRFKYNDKEDYFYLKVDQTLGSLWIVITREQLSILRASLSKYLEWELMAVKQKITLNKEIPDSKIITKVSWTYGDNWYYANGFNLHAKFFSSNTKKHEFVLYSNKVNSTSNQFIDIRLDNVYLVKDGVDELLEATSDKFINEKIEAHRKQKEKEEMFN